MAIERQLLSVFRTRHYIAELSDIIMRVKHSMEYSMKHSEEHPEEYSEELKSFYAEIRAKLYPNA